MVTKEYSEALVEVLQIINSLNDGEKNKIPPEIIKFYEENKSSTYKPIIDLTPNNLDKAILKNKTREILAGIYLNYLCNDEEEKKEYRQELRKTEYNYEKAKQLEYEQKYDKQTTIKNSTKDSSIQAETDTNTDTTSNSNSLIKYEKSNIILRIWNKFLSFFKKK